MEANEIFVVLIDPNDYESIPSLIGYTNSKGEADALCIKLAEMQEILAKTSKEVKEHIESLSIKEPELERRLKIPRWGTGLAATEISEEMRKEWDDINAENTAIDERNSTKNKARQNEIIEAVAEYVNGLTHDDEVMNYIRTNMSQEGFQRLYSPRYYNESVKEMTVKLEKANG